MGNLPRPVPLAQDELSPELKTTISRIAVGVLVRVATTNNPMALESLLDIFEWVSFAHEEPATTGELMRQARQYEHGEVLRFAAIATGNSAFGASQLTASEQTVPCPNLLARRVA